MRSLCLVFVAGCYAVTTPRMQAPVYDTPEGTTIGLTVIECNDHAAGCRRIREALRYALESSFTLRGFPLVGEAAAETAQLQLSIVVDHWPHGGNSDVDITFVMSVRHGAELDRQRAWGSLAPGGNRLALEPGYGNGFQNVTGLLGGATDEANTHALASAAVGLFASAYMPTPAGWQVIELDPEGGNPGIELAQAGRFVDAIGAFQRVGNPAAMFNIAQLLVVAGLDRSARSYYERAVAGGVPNAERYLAVCVARASYQRPLPLPP